MYTIHSYCTIHVYTIHRYVLCINSFRFQFCECGTILDLESTYFVPQHIAISTPLHLCATCVFHWNDMHSPLVRVQKQKKLYNTISYTVPNDVTAVTRQNLAFKKSCLVSMTKKENKSKHERPCCALKLSMCMYVCVCVCVCACGWVGSTIVMLGWRLLCKKYPLQLSPSSD